MSNPALVLDRFIFFIFLRRGEGGFRHPLYHGVKGCDRNLLVGLSDGC
jgi:hypothetical protein